MSIPNNVKLGKLAPKHDSRTLKLANYLKTLPPIPAIESWLYKPELQPEFKWNMYRNDEMGNCAIASPAHIEMIWSHNASIESFTPTDDMVVSDYSKVSGYNPQDSSTDVGCIMLHVMNAWRNTGICTRRINSYVSVNPKNLDQVRAAIHLFGAVNIGLSLPASAQGQKIWSVTDKELRGSANPNSWGGHAVCISEYDNVTNEFVCITWGVRQRMTYEFFLAYCDECYAALSPSWISSSGFSPSGFDMAALQADLKSI